VPVIGLISDIHANLPALEAVLADVERSGVDALVCLGDVVGYGPSPRECLDLIARTCEVMIRGNHEDAVLDTRLAHRFSSNARASVQFTLSQLAEDDLDLIRLMPPLVEIGDLSLAHATFGPERYEYLYTADQAANALSAMRTPLGAVGHTHLPSVFISRPPQTSQHGGMSTIEVKPLAPMEETLLQRGMRVILNPGSVGQPRDGNPDASWGVLDSSRMTFQVRRVAYDVAQVQRDMARLGLPDRLGDRLRVGA